MRVIPSLEPGYFKRNLAFLLYGQQRDESQQDHACCYLENNGGWDHAGFSIDHCWNAKSIGQPATQEGARDHGESHVEQYVIAGKLTALILGEKIFCPGLHGNHPRGIGYEP